RAVAGAEERLFVGHRLVPDARWYGDALDVETPVGEDALECAQRRAELRGVPRCDDNSLDDGLGFGDVVLGGFRHFPDLRSLCSSAVPAGACSRARLPSQPYSPRPPGNLGARAKARRGGRAAGEDASARTLLAHST